jgi:cation diffusion facilitator family transporter
VGFGGNLILFVLKIVVGLLSGSIAVIVDSLNNLLDSASSIITMIGFRKASKKGDHSHPHGHGRIEYVAAFMISSVIIVTALVLGIVSIQRVIEPTIVEASTAFIVTIALALVGKGLIAIFYLWENRKVQSQMLAASGRDALADILSTGVTLVALIFAPLTSFPVDGVVGVAISILILILGGKLFLTNLHLLVGQRPDRRTLRDIRKIVLEKESFKIVEDVEFHDYGPENRKALVKVRLAPGMSKYKIERDIDLVQQELLSTYSTEVTIYWPPRDS